MDNKTDLVQELQATGAGSSPDRKGILENFYGNRYPPITVELEGGREGENIRTMHYIQRLTILCQKFSS